MQDINDVKNIILTNINAIDQNIAFLQDMINIADKAGIDTKQRKATLKGLLKKRDTLFNAMV